MKEKWSRLLNVSESKLIAEFMRYEEQDMSFRIPKHILKVEQENDCPNSQDVDCWDVPLKSLKFHKSWHWLMPVVAKITRDEKYLGNDYREHLMDVVPYGYVEDTYDAVVEFIKQLNKEV
tara:strand:+ start:1096 stop:1455 length:360 start_codon:yes stop_codon:yes gene_type:complete